MPDLGRGAQREGQLKDRKMDDVASLNVRKYGLRATETTRHAHAPELTALAHQFVLQGLKKHGNGISPDHALALRQLLSGFTDQGLRINKGRFAYALPCGAGKTLSVISWIAAQHHLGLGLSIAVSAQQIEALCEIKAALINAGVPEDVIGIRHTKGRGATYPDTGDEDRQIMLGSHARIRGAEEMPDFCRHRGVPRDLLIWDESLISSDTTVLDLSYTETALMHCAKGASRPLLQDVLSRLYTAVKAEKDAQATGIAPRIFTLLTEAESEAALVQIGRPYCANPGERNLFEAAQRALRLMAHPVTLLDVGSGESGIGLMRYQIMVDPELDNIAVLDASFIVRELCKADPTIRNGTTTAMQEFKCYRDVLVKHSVASSGRYQFDGCKVDRLRALRAAVDSIVSIPKNEHVLVFTYKEDRPADLIALIREELRAEGIDPDEMMLPQKPRFVFSTWGRHTTDNSYSHCEHVVLVGVLRMSRLQLGAAMAGQKDDPSFRMSVKDLLAVEYSELASNILQAANRGRCRLTTVDGRAKPMTIHLLTKETQLQPLLEKAMPGLQWETVAKTDDKLAQPLTRTHQLARQIVDYVSALPAQSRKISLKAIYAATSTALAKDARADAMNEAIPVLHMRAVCNGGTPWVKSGLSLVR